MEKKSGLFIWPKIHKMMLLWINMKLYRGLPRCSGKESTCQCRRRGFDLWVESGRSPGVGNGNLIQNPCLENSKGQRSLKGCSPWGHTQLDMTERLSTSSIKLHTFDTAPQKNY